MDTTFTTFGRPLLAKSCYCPDVFLLPYFCQLYFLLRVDRARWITALTEHKQADAFTCKEGMFKL